MAKKITITVKDITKTFGGRNLFSPVNFTAFSGDCLVITGSNGAGKTTLLKMLARLIRPSAGKIEMAVGDTPLTDSEQMLPYLGLVSPEVILYDQLTARENIKLLSQARGAKPDMKKIEDAIQMVGLPKDNPQYIKTYSTGMKQRLKFALLTAIDPPVWLIDEGLSNLDAAGRDLILALIQSAITSRHLIVLATNEQAEVAYASQTIILSKL